VLASVADGLVHLGQRSVDLGLAVRVVELVDRLAELLAVVACLVGLGGRPDGHRHGREDRGGHEAAADPAQKR
jgi:hypothetical protein